ncbi:alcohol acetyltransferase [Brachybacterium squillarum]|uniref:alcohol acetyltransferase n=1 Tax=Brachybacterium squillarum TaxID=661979 RepID=UPI00222234BA|nr:alcohol acetyltransferase [Brachybacterium squillarum]MCW1805420.1 alcohol acetyltransferase [Brachybacterium squillarum]
MSTRAWARLDNASNIFLAARSARDPKVFRLGAELDHEVDPVLLQRALELTVDRYPLFRAVLRRGLFWYYLQGSDKHPQVVADVLPPCAPLYEPGHPGLLFRVVHHGDRVGLEVFHALVDGTGALWFLGDLLAAYLRLRGERPGTDAERETGEGIEAESSEHRGITGDAFRHHFRRRRIRDRAPDPARFARDAAPAALRSAEELASLVPTGATRRGGRAGRDAGGRGGHHRPRVHRVHGELTPDLRPRTVELSMPADQVLVLSRAAGVSLSSYLTALLLEGVRRSSGGLGTGRTLAVSVPVNLRQFFPSRSPRNFFATVRLEHTYAPHEADPEVEVDLDELARSLEEGFRPQVSAEALAARLRRLIGLEQMLVPRLVPRPLKDLLLRIVNARVNRSLTLAVSNLGRAQLPEPAEAHVRRMMFEVSAVRPQFCAISHAGVLTVSFTAPFVRTDHVREVVRLLVARGVEVSVAATRVTEHELAEVGA